MRLLELLHIDASRCAISCEPRRIFRNLIQHIRNFLRAPRRNIKSKSALHHSFCKFTLRIRNRDDRLRLREQAEQFARKKRISRARLLRDKTEVCVAEE